MSQNQPQPPETGSQTPQTPAPTRATSQKVPLLQKVTQTLQQAMGRSQPVLKVQSIKALEGTIVLLEGVVKKLKAEPTKQPSTFVAVDTAPESSPVPVDTVPDIPAPQEALASPPIETPTTAPILETPVNTPAVKQPASENKLPVSTTSTFVDKFLPSFDRVQNWRDAALQKIRAILPPKLNQQLSDWGLTGAVAVSVVLLLWTTVAFLQVLPPDVAKIPPAEIKTPPELKAPLPPSPVEIAPSPLASTPEQNLIASIQNQVADITKQYADSLIQSISANFQGSLLIVKVGDAWYNLSFSVQDKLADEMLRRSQALDFSKLKITDAKDTLLARSPVVGSHMVIFKRQ